MCTVTVVMAAYNAKHFIAEAVNSVIAQTFDDWELIIVDDHSGDGMAEFVRRKYADFANIRIYSMGHNLGPSKARNFGISLAKGAWIAVLDSDDKFEPTRLENLVAACERDGLDLVADNLMFYNDANRAPFQKAFTLSKPFIELSPELLLKNDGPPLRFSFGTLKPVVRKTFLQDNAVAYPEHLRIGEDFVFLFSCLMSGARARLLADHYYLYTVPQVRSHARSRRSRTNYGAGNIESLIHANSALQTLWPRDVFPHLASLFRRRHGRLMCGLAVRDIDLFPSWREVQRLLLTRGCARFLVDKARNVFQRCHEVREY